MSQHAFNLFFVGVVIQWSPFLVFRSERPVTRRRQLAAGLPYWGLFEDFSHLSPL